MVECFPCVRAPSKQYLYPFDLEFCALVLHSTGLIHYCFFVCGAFKKTYYLDEYQYADNRKTVVVIMIDYCFANGNNRLENAHAFTIYRQAQC